MADELIRDWHPLDRGVPEEYVPDFWDGPHVGKRLVEALRTLAAMPHSNGPRQFGGVWPEISHMFDGDQNAWLTPDPRTGLVPDRPPLAMMKARPSCEQVTRMEHAIGWPGRYVHDRFLLTVVGMAALGRSRNRDLELVARKMRRAPRLVREANRDGLDMIAAGLRRDCVVLF